MLSAGAKRWIFRMAVVGLSATIAVYVALFAVLAKPHAFFSHAATGGLVTFHATSPLPDSAPALGESVTRAFVASPLGLPSHDVDIWLVDEGWQVDVFFAGSARASGLTYPVASTRNVFLRHADLEANRLVRGDYVVRPPRTLSYYLIHEITHLMVAERVGRTQIVRMPRWINEGFADYVALGPAPPGLIARTLSGGALPASEFGTYAHERVCVTLALARLSDDLDRLFALRDPLPPEGGCPVSAQFGIAPVEAAS